MKRLQLFEFGDLPWWPAVLRDCVTDALARTVAPVGYQWRAGVVRGRGGPAITYLIGVPLASA